MCSYVMVEVTETRYGLKNKFQNLYWKYMIIVCFLWSIRFPLTPRNIWKVIMVFMIIFQ